jgi:hypothetical protein
LEVAQLESENEALKTYAMKLEGYVPYGAIAIDLRERLGLSETMMQWIIPNKHYALLTGGDDGR